MSCYDREILSRYQDGALADAECRRIASHLDGCADCRETLLELGRAGLYLRLAVGGRKSAECLTEEEVGAYLSGAMFETDRRRVEEHLANCRWCLHEIAVMSDDSAVEDPEQSRGAPADESPRPDAQAFARFAKLAPAPVAPRRVLPWRRIASVAAALLVAASAGWYALSRPAGETPANAVADWRPLGTVADVSFDGMPAATGSVELARFARETAGVLREIERVHESPRREAFDLVREDILNSGLVESVARLREFTREERDRRFLNDCEYVLMQVVKADGRDLDSPDGDLSRIVSEMRRLKLSETARLIELEGNRSQWLAGL